MFDDNNKDRDRNNMVDGTFDSSGEMNTTARSEEEGYPIREEKEEQHYHRPHRGYEDEIYEPHEKKAFHEERKETQKEHSHSQKQQENYYHERVKEATPKKKKNWSKFIAACLVISIAGGGTMGISLGITQRYLNMWGSNTSDTVVETSSPVKTTVSEVKSGASAVDIIKEVKPSVVSISTKVDVQYGYFGGMVGESVGAGSGVVFYSDHDKIGIATNDHVIEGAKEISVTFEDDKTVLAKVAGTDSTSDLAVLIVSAEDLKAAGVDNVKVASFGISSDIQVGESVIAIGNALGEGISVTDGIISATGKKINVDGRELQVIQTNAAINKGNSGGALVNSAGEIIGINTARSFSNMAEGMGYAIPSDIVTPIVEKLLTEGTAPKPYIGIRGGDISNDTAQLYKLPVGVLVVEVLEGGSAEQAGLQQGDVITEFAGENILSMNKLVEVLAKQKVNDTVSMHIIRDGSIPMDIDITILDANEQ